MSEGKKMNVSKQRQVTTPKIYFDAWGIPEERTVEMTEEGLLMKPVVNIPDDFAEQLFKRMIAQGLSGQELLNQFKEAKNNAGWTRLKSETENDTI